MDTTNPLLKREQAFAFEDAQPMTLDGTLIKTAILLALCVVSACAAWTAQPAVQMLLLMVGLLGGFVAVLVACFKPVWSPVLAPAYAILEGFVVGTISSFMEKQYHGLVANASMLTFGVLGAMLLLFVTRVIRVTDKLRAGIFAATLAVGLIYLVDVVLHYFGVSVPFMHQTGAMGIGFSLVVVGIAAFNLLLDFDAIEMGIRQRSPRHMEWYCGMALLVTLVWLYLEILRLLSKFRSRN